MEANKIITCPTCEGKKTWACIAKLYTSNGFVDQPAVMMDCRTCGGKGELTEQAYADKMEEKRQSDEMWCRCGEEDKYGSTHHPDSEGMKHHYTCNSCGKITQIG